MDKSQEMSEIWKAVPSSSRGDILKFLKVSERSTRANDATEELLQSLALRLRMCQRAN